MAEPPREELTAGCLEAWHLVVDETGEVRAAFPEGWRAKQFVALHLKGAGKVRRGNLSYEIPCRH